VFSPGARVTHDRFNAAPFSADTSGPCLQQDRGVRLYLDPTISGLNADFAQERPGLTFKRKDLQVQLSKMGYWLPGRLRKPFRPEGGR